jgi:hypothetical protein
MLLPHDLDKIKRSPRPCVVIFIELENIFVFQKDWAVRIFLKATAITGMNSAGLNVSNRLNCFDTPQVRNQRIQNVRALRNTSGRAGSFQSRSVGCQ